MKSTKAILCFVATLGLQASLLAACGGEGSIEANLVAPERREAKLTVSPALDVSALIDPTLADRIVIEEITVNLAEARLLGANPGIPAGGFPLMSGDKILTNAPGIVAGIELPFPPQFLEDDDLAVFLRIDDSEELEGASVVVRARLYSAAVSGSLSSLLADETGATDPDGEPSKTGATDPDGEPSYQGNCGATDPDGEPSKTNCSGRSLDAVEGLSSIPFELRDTQAANLVASLNRHSELEVVVGIPAARWFSAEAIAALDSALAIESQPETAKETEKEAAEQPDVVVLKTRAEQMSPSQAASDKIDPNASQDYFVSSDQRTQGGTVRRD